MENLQITEQDRYLSNYFHPDIRYSYLYIEKILYTDLKLYDLISIISQISFYLRI